MQPAIRVLQALGGMMVQLAILEPLALQVLQVQMVLVVPLEILELLVA